MSHVRNLFHKPDAYGTFSSPVSVAAAPELVARTPVVKEFATKTSLLPEFPVEPSEVAEFAVEPAHIRPEHRLIFYTDPHSPAADRFRYLRMRLREPWNGGKLKRLLITSPLPQDGKSTVSLNLATALSERGRRSVLLIEADLHKAGLSEKLGLKSWAGLAECLHDGSNPLSAIRRIDPFGWHLLPAGELPKNPTDLLQTPALAGLIDRVSSHFDWILIDSPPALLLTDAISLQQHVDASLMVVRAGRTPREAVEKASALLGPKKVMGILLNGVGPRDQLYSKYRADKYL